MATWEDIRAVARVLPGAWENDWRGEPLFQVGRKGFVQTSRGGVIMKLDRDHQELLFEARPDVFKPMMAGALRWSWVEIDALDADEIADLVREAWTQVVPKKVSRAYSSSPGRSPIEGEVARGAAPNASPPAKPSGGGVRPPGRPAPAKSSPTGG